MAEITSQISFSKLISHTFPGVFVTIGIFLVLYMLFSNYIDSLFSLLQGQGNSWATFIGAVGSLIFFATIVGILIDTLSHIIIEFINYDLCLNNKPETRNRLLKLLKPLWDTFFFLCTIPLHSWLKNKCQEIKKKEGELLTERKIEKIEWFYYIGFLTIDRFIYIDENYYCYQECLLNLSFSFLLSAIAYFVFIHSYGSALTAIIVFLIFFLLFCFCFNAGLFFCLKLRLNRIEFIKGALDHLKQP